MTDILDRAITTAEIKSFISGKRIAGCPVCHHYDWQIKDETRSLSCECCGDEAGPGKPTKVGIIMLVCQNCGALEFHDRAVIARWLDCHPRR